MKGKTRNAHPEKQAADASRCASRELEACVKQHGDADLAVISAAVSDLKRVDGVELARMMLGGETISFRLKESDKRFDRITGACIVSAIDHEGRSVTLSAAEATPRKRKKVA